MGAETSAPHHPCHTCPDNPCIVVKSIAWGVPQHALTFSEHVNLPFRDDLVRHFRRQQQSEQAGDTPSSDAGAPLRLGGHWRILSTVDLQRKQPALAGRPRDGCAFLYVIGVEGQDFHYLVVVFDGQRTPQFHHDGTVFARALGFNLSDLMVRHPPPPAVAMSAHDDQDDSQNNVTINL